jgi:hypothetical protein
VGAPRRWATQPRRAGSPRLRRVVWSWIGGAIVLPPPLDCCTPALWSDAPGS